MKKVILPFTFVLTIIAVAIVQNNLSLKHCKAGGTYTIIAEP